MKAYIAMILAAISICAAAMSITIALTYEAPQPDPETQANCIAEYAYTHPQQNKFDNLVAALKVCN